MSAIFNLIENFLARSQGENRPNLLVILGPTASGKTALSLKIAEKYPCEIISADSRQFYIGMDIATDKISPEIRQKIPHHLVDIVTPEKTVTLFDFKKKAENAIDHIHRKNKLPVLIGGTMLYISVITENYQLPDIKPDFALRYDLSEELRTHGQDYLYEKLKKIDPLSASRIDPRNHRYLLRALEINLLSGSPKNPEKGQSPYRTLKIGIEWPREILYQKINERVENQIKNGLIEETENLLKKYPLSLPSMSSLGYPQIAAYLRGDLRLDEAVELLKKDTRNYARRQLTWFRRDREIVWVSLC